MSWPKPDPKAKQTPYKPIDWSKVRIPLVKNMHPSLIADQIVGVQPMSSGTNGSIFVIKNRYGDPVKVWEGTTVNAHKTCPEFEGQIHIPGCSFALLGFLLIKGCTVVRSTDPLAGVGARRYGLDYALDILNSFLPNNRGMEAVYECQSTLLVADLRDFAHL